jgi:hypothetical protein
MNIIINKDKNKKEPLMITVMSIVGKITRKTKEIKKL